MATEATATEERRAGTGRLIAARIVTVLAVLVAFVGGIAFYLERTLLDEEGIEPIARGLVQDDEVREQVALTAVDQLYANVDVEEAIAQRLPPNQQGLAPVLAGITRQGAEETAGRLLQRPRLQEAWVATVIRTQDQLVKLLEDEGELIRTEGGVVVLDLRPVVIELGDQVAIIGRIAEELPESAGRVAIVESDQLDTAQTIASILKVLANWLWIVALLLAALAIWLARGRRRLELRALAIGLVVVGLLTLLARRFGGNYLVGELTTDATEPAGWNAWQIVTQGLADRAWIGIVLGALALVGVWLVGPSALAGRARGFVAPVAANPWWTYGIVALLVVALAALLPLFQRGLWGVLVFFVLLVAGVEFLRRYVLGERRSTAA